MTQNDEGKSRIAIVRNKKFETNLQIENNNGVTNSPRLTNTINYIMNVEQAEADEMIPVVEGLANSTSHIADMIFSSELATSMCTMG